MNENWRKGLEIAKMFIHSPFVSRSTRTVTDEKREKETMREAVQE